jgi:hypothetical protein
MAEPRIQLAALPTVARLREDLFSAFAAAEAPTGAVRSTPPRVVSRRHGRLRNRILVSAAAAIATVLVAVVVLTGTAGRAAWAVQVRPDGTVAITLRQLVAVDDANARLARLGLPILIQRVKASCPARGTVDRSYSTVAILTHIVRRAEGSIATGAQRWLIDPHAIPRGDTLGLVATLAPPASRSPSFAYGAKLYRGPAPECVKAGSFR